MFGRYILKRIGYLFLTYVIIIFIFSCLFNAVMENTLRSQISEQVKSELVVRSQKMHMTAEQSKKFIERKTEELYHRYHLDQPVVKRIFWRTYNTLTFKWGKSSLITSSDKSRQVKEIVFEAVPPTLLLFTTAMVVDVLVGIYLGIKKAQKPGKTLDQSTSITTMVVFGMPSWWLAMILIMVFVYVVPLFPSGGLHSVPPPEGIMYYIDIIWHLALPLLTIVSIGFWGRAYITRNIVLGVLQEDFIMSARARGIPESKVLYGHTLRTAAPPIATMSIMAILASLGGNLILEGIFSWPGMGNLYWIALQSNDIPVLIGNLAVTTLLYLAGLLILDILYVFLDPRIKAGGREV